MTANDGAPERERLLLNAELDASIREHTASTSYGDRLLAEGETIVALRDEGTLVEYRPDGSQRMLE